MDEIRNSFHVNTLGEILQFGQRAALELHLQSVLSRGFSPLAYVMHACMQGSELEP